MTHQLHCSSNIVLIGIVLLLVSLHAFTAALSHPTGEGNSRQQHSGTECSETISDSSNNSFFYVSFIEGMVGGMTTTARSIYLDDVGDLEVSEFTTDGILLNLRRASGFTSSFDALKSLLKTSVASVAESSGKPGPSAFKKENHLVTDYHPSTTVYTFRLGNNLKYFEKLTDRTPTGVSDAIELLRSLAEEELESAQENGLFVRAEPSQLVREPDVLLKESSKIPDERLQSLLERPLKLVQFSSEKKPTRLDRFAR